MLTAIPLLLTFLPFMSVFLFTHCCHYNDLITIYIKSELWQLLSISTFDFVIWLGTFRFEIPRSSLILLYYFTFYTIETSNLAHFAVHTIPSDFVFSHILASFWSIFIKRYTVVVLFIYVFVFILRLACTIILFICVLVRAFIFIVFLSCNGTILVLYLTLSLKCEIG